MTNIIKPVSYSQTWTFFEGKWHEGNAPIMGPRTHAAWLGSTVFDGARAFEGATPDLDRHCARVNWSATNFRLKPVVDTQTWIGLAREGVARFGANFLWQIRLEAEGRQQICYKFRAAAEDPVRNGKDAHLLTTAWEDKDVNWPGATTFGVNARLTIPRSR